MILYPVTTASKVVDVPVSTSVDTRLKVPLTFFVTETGMSTTTGASLTGFTDVERATVAAE